jgi:iron-sulfur cluster insertion protein
MSLTIEESAVKRIEEIRKKQGKTGLLLRVTVEGGGCSGFQYKMALTDQISKDDEVFENTLVTDEMSLPFLNGSILRYDESLIGAEFTIENPNAASGCGCGASFSV